MLPAGSLEAAFGVVASDEEPEPLCDVAEIAKPHAAEIPEPLVGVPNPPEPSKPESPESCHFVD